MDFTTHWYGYDGHGSVRFLASLDGQAITDTYTYDAFGILIAETHLFGPTPNNYLYAGEQFDRHLGLYYNRARYLNANTGRFWTRDSFAGFQEDPYSLHKYLYAHADPVNNIDPSGRFSLTEMQTVAAVTLVLFATTQYSNAPRNDTEAHDAAYSRSEFPYAELAGFLPSSWASYALVQGSGATFKTLGIGAAFLHSKLLKQAVIEINKRWPKHHPWPQYLGGLRNQTLKKLPPNHHKAFHKSLDNWKKGKYHRNNGADYYKDMNAADIIIDLRHFYKYADKGRWRKYLPDFEQAVKETLESGK